MPRGPPPLKKPLRQNEFYCLKCRARVRVPADELKVRHYTNKKLRYKVPMLKGLCHKCESTVNKIVKRDSAILRRLKN